MQFPTSYLSITERIDRIDAIQYARTRNFLDGAVTCLSPYLSRGVISLPLIKDVMLKRYKYAEAEKLIQELAWREYWQRVWQSTGDGIFTDLKHTQQQVTHKQLAVAIQQASTGIDVIDENIRSLYTTGYMHNHCRMYLASIACNIGQAHWFESSRWMYYHLLDGDLASNSLSWQWVAGTFSSKKYFCNQENINKYSHTHQASTFLDTGYDALVNMAIPEVLKQTQPFMATTPLPPPKAPYIDATVPTLVYNSYNLDPLWHKDVAANRILLLEPSHFTKYPVSSRVLDFILALAANISNIQVFTGEIGKLQQLANTHEIIFKAHPSVTHYSGKAESCDWMFPAVSGYFNSFSAYWKKCQKYLR